MMTSIFASLVWDVTELWTVIVLTVTMLLAPTSESRDP